MDNLQCLAPTYQPRVSKHMKCIKDMIAQILDNGCAYEVEGDVYFSVDKSPNYSQLSGQKLENNIAGKRVDKDPRKKNPADFALWKVVKPDEPYWESPWGRGRPGWHIECSGMSAAYLGYSFDIHGGGMDLIFPHHENELAQSCACSPEANVGYWVHNGFVNVKNKERKDENSNDENRKDQNTKDENAKKDEKMSKSLGNFFTIREVTDLYHPLALRHFLLSTHYRSTMNFSLSLLDTSSEYIFYIYQTLQDCEDAISSFRQRNQGKDESKGKTARITSKAKEYINKLHSDFEIGLSDDLHTQDILNETLKKTFEGMNSYMTNLKKEQDKQQQLSLLQFLIDLEKEVKEILDVLGLLSSSSYAEVLQRLKDKALKRADLEEKDVLRFEKCRPTFQDKN